MDMKLAQGSIEVGPHLRVSFQRTLRIPDDGNDYPLPPGLGEFPVFRARDFARRLPAGWGADDLFIPMYQREALWLNFDCPYWRATAVKIGVGGVNAVSGKRWHERLNRSRRRQDYVVCPDQPWLDGINAGDGFIRQFVAMPLGMGYTVEGQLTGREDRGGIQILAYEPKPGRFPDEPPADRWGGGYGAMMVCDSAQEMGLGAGGRMRQEIYPDPHGADSLSFREITGMEPPPTPVSAEHYTRLGLPWFRLYDERKGDLRPSRELERVRSIREKDTGNGFGSQQDDSPLAVPADQVVGIDNVGADD
jgi:hypothetical protein